MSDLRIGDMIADIQSGDWGESDAGAGLAECIVLRATDFRLAARGDLSLVPRRYLRVNSLGQRRLRADDFLVELSGGSADQPTGRLLRVPPSVERSDVVFSNFVKRLRLRPEIDPGYFAYAWMMLYQRGATRPYEKRTTGIRNFKLDDFLASESIAVPPLAEQRRIAGILEKIQRAQDTQAAVLSAGTTVARAVAASMESRFGSGTAEIGEVAEVGTGATPPTGSPQYWGTGTPFVRTSEIRGNRIFRTLDHVTAKAVRDGRTRVYPAGTVFMAMYGQGKTRGNVGLLEIDAATSQNTAAIQCDRDRMDSRFLYYVLKGRYAALRSEGIQGHISHLNARYVRRVVVPCPPLEIQREYVAVVDTLERNREADTAIDGALTAVFASALSSLMGRAV